MSTDTETLVPVDVYDAAEKWETMHRQYWSNRGKLLAWVQAHGPVRLADGRLCGLHPDGNDFDAEGIAEVMPQLVRHVEAVFTGPTEKVERVLSLALEEVPDIEWKVKRTVDARAVNDVLRGGGEAAEKLKPFKLAKNKLSTR